MSTFHNATSIRDRLHDLSEALELEGSRHLDLLICGGAALSAMGLVARATDDIDVLALVLNETDVAAKPFPHDLTAAIKTVASVRGISEEWMNPGPADMQSFGLPVGIVGRATRQEYGNTLTVRFLARYDQIHLKLYAAVDLSGGKHLTDLNELSPTSEEILDAARWCLTQDPSNGFQQLLLWFLKAEGFGDVVDQLSK